MTKEQTSLTLAQIGKLRQLKSEFAYDLALFKKEFEEDKLSETELLGSLVMFDINKRISAVMQESYTTYVENNILEAKAFLALASSLCLAISVNGAEDLREFATPEDDTDFSQEFLLAYQGLNPGVGYVTFSDEEIQEYYKYDESHDDDDDEDDDEDLEE